MSLAQNLVERICELRVRDATYWEDEFYSSDALTNPEYRATLAEEAKTLHGIEIKVAVKQAQKLPAWAHIENDYLPAPASGKTYAKEGSVYVDPADHVSYEADGHGMFHGTNGKKVREHPKVTLLAVTHQSCELTYHNLFALLTYGRAAAKAIDKKAESDLDFIWLIDRLHAHEVEYTTQLVPGSDSLKVIGSITNLSAQNVETIQTDITNWLQQRKEQKEAEKQAKREDREYMKNFEINQQRELEMKAKDEELQVTYTALFEKATAAGITDERFGALLKQTAAPGADPSLSDETLALLSSYIDNEIQVIAAKAEVKEKAAVALKETFPVVAGIEIKNDTMLKAETVEGKVVISEVVGEEKKANEAKFEKSFPIDDTLDAISQDIAQAEAVVAEIVNETSTMGESSGSAQTEQPDGTTTVNASSAESASLDAEENAKIDLQGKIGPEGRPASRETYVDEDGCIFYSDTNEMVQASDEYISALTGDAPVAEREKKFAIDSEDAARWYIRKVRSKERNIEQAKQEFDEAKLNYEKIKRENESDIKGFRWLFANQFCEWLYTFIPKNKKGELTKESHTFFEGVAKLKSVGGLVCYDPAAYKAWWKTMCAEENDAERAMYSHTAKYSQGKTQIELDLKAGLEIPGYRLDPIQKYRDFEIAPAAKSRKKSEDSNDEEMEDVA